MEEETTVEILQILKALSDKVKDLERKLAESDTAIMKAGFVRSPRPSARNSAGMPSGDVISKMDWSDLDSLVRNLGGNQ
jgi:hypothetical protein